MQENKDLQEFSAPEVKLWLKTKNFSDETVENFEDEQQKIDGKALIYLAEHGSAQQYEACGLKTVGEQLHFKQIVKTTTDDSTTTSRLAAGCRKAHKPRKEDIRKLSPMNQRIYKTKRSAVRQAAINKWPGNDIPTFKKKSTALEELEELVNQLKKECSFEPADFDRKGIKQHVLDVLNERRRHLRSGHDYTKEDKRKLKKVKTDSDGSSSMASTASTEILSEQSEDEDLSPRKGKTSPQIIPETYTDDDSDYDQPLTQVSNNQPKEDDKEDKMTDEEKSTVPSNAAQIIMQVAFNALQFKDISKKQLISYVKKYKLHLKPTTLEKNMCAQLLAEYFIQEGYVKVQCPLNKIDREKVYKLKVF
ncbi:uncharacterized protein LOC116287382 [Actinia tenebrosa]|uniref:Uncharacterized protein LOC116287382 n=1 Tax=Actinia tenebrosa TaxID=6105 RepID=A0A6P8H0G2_ACTTE|nr:uncharacterized protein LOC116287382 [Actinia tenebrosa]